MITKYGKLTKYGVRKLYKAPAGMTEAEYAAQLGFKPLVEPEKPAEGYWVPEWHETENELVLTWVETDPPSEDEMI